LAASNAAVFKSYDWTVIVKARSMISFRGRALKGQAGQRTVLFRSTSY
jgi:hypothetical protein